MSKTTLSIIIITIIAIMALNGCVGTVIAKNNRHLTSDSVHHAKCTEADGNRSNENNNTKAVKKRIIKKEAN